MTLFEPIDQRRLIIDRRSVSDAVAALPVGDDGKGDRLAILRDALATGRREVERRLTAEPGAGRTAARANAYLHDQLLRIIYEHVGAGGLGNKLAIVGLGGTGRGEMAPHSDVDLMFLTADNPSAQVERCAEAMLHILWDLKLKVGYSVRSVDQMIDYAKKDMTVRTACLESRLLWGAEDLYAHAGQRFRKDVVAGTAKEFVAAKLKERDERHLRMGDSRYLVEPNVKDGKGGLRDLHTLYWIGKYVHGVERPADLVGAGLFSAAEFRRFDRAERFLWSVRCHLHVAARRAEERLGFEHQRHIAEVMNYADRPGKSAVERFMHFYFINAKTVGDLTGQFLAQLDEQLGKKGFRFLFPAIRRKPKRLGGFMLDRGRLSIPADDFFQSDPVRLIELFAIAAKEQLEIHPEAMRSATRDAGLIDQKVRNDPRANALFMEVLTDIKAPDLVLRWMNEAGVFGRFVPDFGRVVAQMQFDMYHHYTVDEHSIRAIGLLAAIERGELAQDHPLSHALFKQISSRRTLYTAVLLHDIAKGRGGDHSELGAEIALKLCPRLGLDAAETETVSWLVKYHLLMSATAMKRDLADPQTIEDFVRKVQSPERLRLLLILTVVDIRAVGPGVWNEWKRTLLRSLFEAAEERLRLGHKERGRTELVQARQSELARTMAWSDEQLQAYAARFADSYWLAEPIETQIVNARQVLAADGSRDVEIRPSVECDTDEGTGATRITVYTGDREALFYRVCAALAKASANIIDARVHTTLDGKALDNILVLDGRGQPYSDKRLKDRLVKGVKDALASPELPPLPEGERLRASSAFDVAASVGIAERASSRTTVVEVNARDRRALLAGLARAIHECGHRVHSAHIATYGERAVDVFYLTRPDGKKLKGDEVEQLRSALLTVAETG
ncbi:[protein-PII] uridylyltransferase [Sphingomonas piscis]|uniref:Bifunctional uridylyltransferase/uridylyl-removing enzyme n=1 Tax=Sphingomonas piscis TaxID=2714943 RepID=A0A6G7YP88_9SPHN|nr:[protein-PII] uridylyltransferase [Sphingomonas piscis]QIK78551.1 [protein-PII] uridylyltransferase [Sphingomonas piscis]